MIVKAYLKAAEEATRPGDKFRYYYNVLENYMAEELPFLMASALYAAYKASLEDVREKLRGALKTSKPASIDRGLSEFLGSLDSLHDNIMRRVYNLQQNHPTVRRLEKVVTGQVRGELFQLELTLRNIEQQPIIEFLNSSDGTFFLQDPNWCGLNAIHRQNGDVYDQIAKRIYRVRNMVIHSKENDSFRIVPFTEDEARLQLEIPLVKFCAATVVDLLETEES
jgi:hypothetical protein